LFSLSSCALAVVLLAGCIVLPGGRHRGDAGTDHGIVNLAPPAPQVEVRVALPGPGFFWIAGSWTWFGARHVWNPGRWASQRPGHVWQPHQWQRRGQGWAERPGRWERQR